MKTVIKILLRFFTVRILKKYKPDVVAITGSVGKTAAKEAIFAVLKDEFPVRKSEKNYNTEFGVPITIIGTEFPGRNIIAWMFVFGKALKLLLTKQEYPKILVLEMALDKPGDIEYLTNLAPPTIGVVTMIGSDDPVHVEFFKNAEELIKEKMKVVFKVSKKGFAILNRDDGRIWAFSLKVNARLISFGFHEEADIKASHMHLSHTFDTENPIQGISFKITHQGATVPALIPHALGKHQIYAALAACAVGRAYEINLVDITTRLRNVVPPRGRMSLLGGIKHTTIIDDSYNSSPLACKAALEVLGQAQAKGRTFAVLGDMLELGPQTEDAHKMIGKEIVRHKVDYLITIGERARIIGDTALEKGMNQDHVFGFGDSETAGRFVQERIEPGDLILVKGSQSIRTEKVVKEIMAEPGRAEELLVRQSKDWLENV